MLVLHRAKLLASNQSVLALGVAPRRVAGTPVPVFPPLFRGKGAFGKDAEIRTHQALHEAKLSDCPKGDRDRGFALSYKNRLFLQSDRLTLTGKPVCFLHSEQTCPFYSPPAMIYSRQYKKKATLSFVFSLFPYFPVTACCFTVGCYCFPKYIR